MIKQFLTEYLAEAKTGTLKTFNPSAGLCYNIDLWLRKQAIPIPARVRINVEFNSMFDFQTYPFGRSDYLRRHTSRTQHLCPKRIAWIEQQLEVMK